ncbi:MULTISPECIES: ABC transporter substrate-binding protein [unclassified Neorhizobium]|uniref:ABC transporter substrate-binding protein n=1 Tax=unclassified Neorhizobium TaxID=2629175 RepID=UPI001FF367F4|nr:MULTISPECIES: ABC transporter substrate-binding protein [unclassified Neorhizobium]MCJ9668628.1 ABC transporter substrate-binding protein [Neorhizobium sp. SHOUNA12B]MCJ9743892.1 ABC transporter substrate-binding protein [Neorhizobium sp. SHOUNA12A]
MNIWKGFAAAVVAVPLISAGTYAQAQDRSKTLVVAVPSDPVGLEPGGNKAEPVGSEIILNVFDTLVAWTSPEFKQLEGRLATNWTISADGKEFTFKLRDGVKFQDGTPFDAAAVKFSLERTKATNSYVKATFDLIRDIAVVSPAEVKITLSAAYPAFLSILAQPQSAIVSPAAVQKFGDKFAANPVGTGPFVFKGAQADTNVVLEANPGYFRGAPKLSKIIYRVIPDASTRRLELESGGVDIVQQQGQLSAIAAEDIEALKKNKDIKILETSSQIIRQLEFNNNKKDGPFANVKVRQAITHAIDYDGLLNGVFGGTAERVYGPLTTNSWAFNPKMKELAPKYDPALAKKLLAEAKVDPSSLDLKLYSFQGPLWGAVATFVQANLADIGINATIQQTEFPALRALQTSGQFDVALDGRQPWYNDPDAHITIGYLSPLANTAMTFRMPEDKVLDDLILKAQQTSDLEARKQLYFQVQEEIAKKVPGAYLFSPKLIVFERANVEGLVVNSAPPLNEYWSVSKK